MPNTSKSEPGLRKNGTSRRSRTGGSGRGRGTPPIMIAALVVVVVGAALLFWPKGGANTTGIGEQQSVVTVPDSTLSAAKMTSTEPTRSGDVDIAQQEKKLVPEKLSGATQAKVETTKPAPKPEPTPAARAKVSDKPAVPPIEPKSDGRWAVQTGGFGEAANADKEAARLLASGWKAMVRAGSNSQGKMVYRVWIGYFTSRDEAGTFIRQNQKKLADAFVVHR